LLLLAESLYLLQSRAANGCRFFHHKNLFLKSANIKAELIQQVSTYQPKVANGRVQLKV